MRSCKRTTFAVRACCGLLSDKLFAGLSATGLVHFSGAFGCIVCSGTARAMSRGMSKAAPDSRGHPSTTGTN